MSNVTTMKPTGVDLEKANDYLIDAADYVAVLKTFLGTNNDEFDRGRGQVVCKEINRLIEEARDRIDAA